MENLLLPAKVEWQDSERANAGAVVISPCFHGYGTTLGNSLRRVLLSSLNGSAVEAFRVKGAQHEFSTVEGVQEDMVEIMLNLKQLSVKVHSDEPVTLTVSKKGPGKVTGADFEKNSGVEIINKNLVIANLTANKTFEMEIIVGKGRGFKTVEEKDRKSYDLGMIVIDSIYTPIRDVGYKVENTRVGDITDYEKLTLNIETNGTVSPHDSLRQATQILMDHFAIILESSVASTQTVTAEEPVEASAELAGVESGDSEDGEGEKKKKTKSDKKDVKAKKAKKK